MSIVLDLLILYNLLERTSIYVLQTSHVRVTNISRTCYIWLVVVVFLYLKWNSTSTIATKNRRNPGQITL